MINVMPILKEYQHLERNARVYKTANGEYGVIVYDSTDDFNGFESFQSESSADSFAETWVIRGQK